MPFTTVKTEELIENMKQKDAEFAKQKRTYIQAGKFSF